MTGVFRPPFGRSFVAVAEEGKIGRAAIRLFITQPALSRQMQQLEREIGEPLFARVPRGVELTDAGRELLREDIVGEQTGIPLSATIVSHAEDRVWTQQHGYEFQLKVTDRRHERNRDGRREPFSRREPSGRRHVIHQRRSDRRGRIRPHHPCDRLTSLSRSSRRSTFPLAVFGSSLTNSI